MKKFALVAGVAAALLLSACGASTPAARSASLHAYVASLGAAAHLQVALTGSASGPGTTAVNAALQDLGVTLSYASATGSALSDSAGEVNQEIVVTVKGNDLVDLRLIDHNLYVKLNASEIDSIPGVNVSASKLAAIQLLVGGRWFELTSQTLNSLVVKKDVPRAKAAEDSALSAKILDDVARVIDTTPYKNLGGGTYSETGTLLSLATAVYPTLKDLAPVTAPTAQAVPGTYTLSITTAGSSANHASVSITDPKSTGAVTASLSATFTHANVAVSVPSGAVLLTTQLLDGLLGGVSTSATASSSTMI